MLFIIDKTIKSFKYYNRQTLLSPCNTFETVSVLIERMVCAKTKVKEEDENESHFMM